MAVAAGAAAVGGGRTAGAAPGAAARAAAAPGAGGGAADQGGAGAVGVCAGHHQEIPVGSGRRLLLGRDLLRGLRHWFLLLGQVCLGGRVSQTGPCSPRLLDTCRRLLRTCSCSSAASGPSAAQGAA